jgi:Fur family ferric uptake transcriptional regulator
MTKLKFQKKEVPKDPQQLKKIIRSIGVKVTDQRMGILEEILNGADHVTAQEVFENVRMKNSDVGFATVYRFLRTLTDHKILSEVRMQGLPARYEWASKEHHDHITCVNCSKISEFESDEIEQLQLIISKKLGYQMTHHILELFGVCGDCQKTQKTHSHVQNPVELSEGLKVTQTV